MSQITSGKLTASHIKARLLGVCVHSVLRDTVLRVLVGGGGGLCSSTGELVLAVEVRVARFVGDALTGDSVGAGGSGKGFGWFLVATIVAESVEERRFDV